MVLRPPRLALEVAFGGQDTFLAGVASFLVTIAVANRYDNVARVPLLLLLAALGTFPRALGSDLSWCSQLMLAAAFTFPRTKPSPTASSLEACRVAK
jgi:hypothetical protein